MWLPYEWLVLLFKIVFVRNVLGLMRDLRLYLLPLLSTKNVTTHFSKGPSNLSQNEKKLKTPFSFKVFHTLSHGVVCFVPIPKVCPDEYRQGFPTGFLSVDQNLDSPFPCHDLNLYHDLKGILSKSNQDVIP